MALFLNRLIDSPCRFNLIFSLRSTSTEVSVCHITFLFSFQFSDGTRRTSSPTCILWRFPVFTRNWRWMPCRQSRCFSLGREPFSFVTNGNNLLSFFFPHMRKVPLFFWQNLLNLFCFTIANLYYIPILLQQKYSYLSLQFWV